MGHDDADGDSRGSGTRRRHVSGTEAIRDYRRLETELFVRTPPGLLLSAQLTPCAVRFD
jgi:hypothetical protein